MILIGVISLLIRFCGVFSTSYRTQQPVTTFSEQRKENGTTTKPFTQKPGDKIVNSFLVVVDSNRQPLKNSKTGKPIILLYTGAESKVISWKTVVKQKDSRDTLTTFQQEGLQIDYQLTSEQNFNIDVDMAIRDENFVYSSHLNKALCAGLDPMINITDPFRTTPYPDNCN